MNPEQIIACREADPAWEWDWEVSAEVKMLIKETSHGDATTDRLCELFPCEADEAHDELRRWGRSSQTECRP